MTPDDEIAALLHEVETGKRREIERLGIPPWENEAEVARVANQRITVEEYSEFLVGLISSGYFQTSDEPFVFNPPTEMEWSPGLPGFENWTEWDEFADALRSGRKKEVARLAGVLKQYSETPKEIRELLCDFLQGKNPAPRRRPNNQITPYPSWELQALKYCERLEPTLRDMFLPEQKPKAVKLRAKKIAAAKYEVTVDDMERVRNLPKSRRR
jgi:hypothetical protein